MSSQGNEMDKREDEINTEEADKRKDEVIRGDEMDNGEDEMLNAWGVVCVWF